MKRKKQTKEKKTSPRWLLIVDADLHDRCEAIATARRKATGAAEPLWSQIARDAMANGLAAGSGVKSET